MTIESEISKLAAASLERFLNRTEADGALRQAALLGQEYVELIRSAYLSGYAGRMLDEAEWGLRRAAIRVQRRARPS